MKQLEAFFLLGLTSKIVTTKHASVAVSRTSSLRQKYSRNLKQMTTAKFMDEVVDDSEPEREELRRKEKDERRKKKRLNTLEVGTDVRDTIELTDEESVVGGNIIEISDDSVSPNLILPISKTWMVHTLSGGSPTQGGVTPASLHASSVIELSDNTAPPSILTSLSAESEPQPMQPKYSSTDTTNDILPSQGPFLKAPVLLDPMLYDSEILRDSESGLDDTNMNLNLARFAYRDSRSSSKLPSSKPGSSRQGPAPGMVTEENPPVKVKSTRIAAHRFISHFSDVELAKLMKCISCDVHWTTRKTAAQKMMHVQSCAKKNILTDETVCVLIRREIDNALIGDTAAKGKGKGKGKAESLALEPVLPRTFYEDVIHDAAPKKKGKHPEVVETVKSVVETREVILDRARTILGLGNPSSIHRDEDFSVQTQAFGGSKLGRALSKRHKAPDTNSMFPIHYDPEHSDVDNSVEDMPANTQQFAPSKLGGSLHPPLYGETVQRPPELRPDPHSPMFSQPNSLNRSTTSLENAALGLFFRNSDVAPLFDLATSSAKEPSHQQPTETKDEKPVGLPVSALPPHSLKPPNPSLVANAINVGLTSEDEMYSQIHELTWDNDNAYLHFDPDLDNQKHFKPANDTVFGANNLTLRHGTNTKPIVKPSQRKPKNYDNEESGIPKCVRKKTKRKGKDREVVDPIVDPHDGFDENWEEKIKTKILENRTLHLRILRYEPIHFDVFLKLATDQPSRGLKARLRSFLDKQAINFYGAEPTGRRP